MKPIRNVYADRSFDSSSIVHGNGSHLKFLYVLYMEGSFTATFLSNVLVTDALEGPWRRTFPACRDDFGGHLLGVGL